MVKISDSTIDTSIDKKMGEEKDHSYSKPSEPFAQNPISNAKYLNPCPQIDLIYSKPDGKMRKVKPIKNGNFEVVSDNKKMYVLQNTAPYDAIFNVMASSFQNFKGFNTYCNEVCKDNFFRSVCEYGKNGIFKDFENTRFLILRKMQENLNSNDIISCNEKVSHYFAKLMGENYSLSVSWECEGCRIQKKSNHNFVQCQFKVTQEILNSKYFVSDLINYYGNNKVGCTSCGQGVYLKCTLHYNYVAIDMEHLDTEIDLYQVQTNFIHNTKTYVLSGAIEFKVSPITGNIDYTAYCRSVKGFWSRKTSGFKLFYNIPKTKCTIKIAMLIYVIAD